MEDQSETQETLDVGRWGVGEVGHDTDHKCVIFEIMLISFTKTSPLYILLLINLF